MKKPIRASDVGAFLYCHRAWWLAFKGVKVQDKEIMKQGRQTHDANGRLLRATFSAQDLIALNPKTTPDHAELFKQLSRPATKLPSASPLFLFSWG
jgi:hypothetical protein